jgi:hypothetical protein
MDDLPGLMFLMQRWGENSSFPSQYEYSATIQKILIINGVLKGVNFNF